MPARRKTLDPGDMHGIRLLRGFLIALFVFGLVHPGGNAWARVFHRASVATDGTESNYCSQDPQISDDGLSVVFISEASNLVENDTNADLNGVFGLDAFVHNRLTGETIRASVADNEDQATNDTVSAAISATGRYVVFATYASLVAVDDNNYIDVYIRDLQNNTTELVSYDCAGFYAANGDSGRAGVRVSRDGRYVAFTSSAYNLTGTDENFPLMTYCSDEESDDYTAVQDIFVRDRVAGVNYAVNVNDNGDLSDQGSDGLMDMTPDGRYVVFIGGGTNLVSGDTNNAADVFVRDMRTMTTTRVSMAADGSQPNGNSPWAAISDDGRFVVFSSDATNLVDVDTNGVRDIFVKDRVAGRLQQVSLNFLGFESLPSEFGSGFYNPDISGDGRYVSFSSAHDDMVTGDTNNWNDVFVRDLKMGRTVRVSVGTDGSQAMDEYMPSPTSISADGQIVAFTGAAGTYVPGDTNLWDDVFLASQSRFELIQAVYNQISRTDGSAGYSLVAGKNLVARAFLGLAPDTPPTDAAGVLCVDHPVASCPASHRFTVTDKLYPVGHMFTDAQRRDAENSMDFLITGTRADTVLTRGVHTFNFSVTPAGGGDAFEKFTARVEGDFRQSSTIDVLVYPIRLTNAAGNPVRPDATLLPGASDLIRSAFPVDEELVENFVQPGFGFNGLPAASVVLRDNAHWEMAKAIERRVLAFLLLLNPMVGRVAAQQTFGAGVVANLLDNSNSIGTPGSPGLMGFTYPAIKGVVVTLDRQAAAAPDNTPVIGSTVAHEMGHQLKFGDEYCYDADADDVLDSPCAVDNDTYVAANPPPRTKEEGSEDGNYITEIMGAYDVGGYSANRKAIFGPPGTPMFGYMGGGNDNNSWTTRVEYEFLYPKLTTANTGGSSTGRKPAVERQLVAITGLLGQDGSLELDLPIVGHSDMGLEPPPGGSHALDFLDDSGSLLESFAFDVPFKVEQFFSDHVAWRPSDTVPFAVVAELPAETQTIRVVSRPDHTLLGQIHRGSHVPTIIITRVRREGDRVWVYWQALDPDLDPLRFMVLYSPDGSGVHMLDTDIEVREYSFDLSTLPTAGKGNYVEVVASDGFNTASDKTRAVVKKGDVNGDWDIGIADSITALQSLVCIPPAATNEMGPVFSLCDVNGDGRVGLPEVTFALDYAAFAGQLAAQLSGSVHVGQATQIVVTAAVIGPLTAISDNPAVATVEGNASPLTVHGISEGETGIHISDMSDTTVYLPIIVRP